MWCGADGRYTCWHHRSGSWERPISDCRESNGRTWPEHQWLTDVTGFVCVCVDVSARWSRLTMKWLMSTLATARRVSPRRRHRRHCHSTGTLLHLLQPLEVCCFDLVPCCYQIASYESHVLLLSSLSSFIVTPTPTSHIYDKLRVRVHQCAALGSTVPVVQYFPQ